MIVTLTVAIKVGQALVFSGHIVISPRISNGCTLVVESGISAMHCGYHCENYHGDKENIIATYKRMFSGHCPKVPECTVPCPIRIQSVAYMRCIQGSVGVHLGAQEA